MRTTALFAFSLVLPLTSIAITPESQAADAPPRAIRRSDVVFMYEGGARGGTFARRFAYSDFHGELSVLSLAYVLLLVAPISGGRARVLSRADNASTDLKQIEDDFSR